MGLEERFASTDRSAVGDVDGGSAIWLVLGNLLSGCGGCAPYGEGLAVVAMELAAGRLDDERDLLEAMLGAGENMLDAV